ncbi:MAG: hypothetical protein EOO07_38850 [Chitinophagaceae bacterium]|nr:MAG: hypothetical protein EOO07_38850 [Chitinophagaceae bacterium]
MLHTINKPAFFLLSVLLLVFISCRNDVTLKDVDGNSYKTVKIGNQIWMAENLKVTAFRNGDPIPNLAEDKNWAASKSASYCDYNKDAKNAKIYGHLYNWYAVNDSRGLAPKGWHIPTSKELEELISFLKSDTIAAAKLKEAGTAHWLTPNNNADNSSGFTALPGGYRFNDGTFHTIRSNGYWWTNNRSFEMYSWSPRIWEGFADVERDPQYLNYGFSVRCIKD